MTKAEQIQQLTLQLLGLMNKDGNTAVINKKQPAARLTKQRQARQQLERYWSRKYGTQ